MNTDYPLITVIIPVWNGEKFLSEALESIHAQEYPSLEIIVVDDGSTDNSAVIAQSDPTVNYYYQNNQGPGAAKNMGLEKANGKFIAFLDCDDIWTRDTLRRHSSYLVNNPSVDIIQSQVQEYCLNNYDQKFNPITVPYFMFALMASSLYRKYVFDSVGFFDTTLSCSEDWDWTLRAYEINIHKEKLEFTSLLYRKHDNNMTKFLTLSQLNLVKVYHRHLKRIRQQENKTRNLQVEKTLDYFGHWPY
ncbi:glycosyltransferase family A protein [Thermosynechococcaceae cyanobacterium BACA0444]|uniref:Glycosyltransferase family A protein n=1 Tax=Pseudocalidococcus azoricus BACA0444 TaxID=2918990 RepID=A0AAE4FTP9_9CYAN|nr:glycosyltransferase family A protein [Pseudocalidococcus azoricus]MDS3861159.1 glycosyltransferase family A protein [Pseudocalidococcus azoricus BACA0444]